MLIELDNLKELIGNHPDNKFKHLNDEEKELFLEFLESFSTCPICKRRNHSLSLKKLYFNEDLENQAIKGIFGLENQALDRPLVI